MKKMILPLILVIVAIGAYFISRSGESLAEFFSKHDPTLLIGSSASKAGSHNSLEITSPYATEEHWMVSEICEDIKTVIDYAATKGDRGTSAVGKAIQIERPADDGLYRIRSSAGSAPFDLAIEDFIWSPSKYEKWARFYADQKRLDLPSPSQDSAESVIGTLLDLRAETIEMQNTRISRWLAEKPLEPSAHEGAALLVAAFALREASGTFYDTRHTLNRLTAHLALARALRRGQELQEAGRLADLALRVLAGRQREALGIIDDWSRRESATPAVQSWLNALSLRADADWRGREATARSSLLEKLECFRSLARHVGSAAAIQLLEACGGENAEPIPDWSRIVLASGYSVQEGHWCAKQGIPFELNELATVHKLRTGRELDEKDISSELNRAPGGAVETDADGRLTISVLDEGAWGREAQRHLCHHAARIESFYRNMYGDASTADRFARAADPYLKGLIYYPVLQRYRAQDQKTYEQAMEGSGKLVQEHPEWVSEYNWGWLRSPHQRFTFHHVVPYNEKWLVPPMPAGAVYNSYARLSLPQVRGGPLTWLDPWRELAPNDEQLALIYARRKYADKFTAEQLQEIAGPLADYDLEIMTWLSGTLEDRPAEYERVLERMCRLDPDKWFELAEYYVDHKMDNKAAEAYQKGNDLANDRVEAANVSGWLVRYYFEHGEVEKALEIAKESAEVGSQSGLVTALTLMERMGRLDEAEQFGEEVKERYDDKGALFGFYFRQVEKAGSDAYRRKLDEIVRTSFDDGMEKVAIGSFAGQPTDGVLFPYANEKTLEAGLKPGCIVVGLEGYRVHNQRQYKLINQMRLSEMMNLIVWQDGRYQEISTARAGRRFGVTIADYSPRR